MLETRRELFRTSVTAALSFSVGAVAGYAAAETFLAPQAAAAGSAGSVVAVHDATAKVWYLFHFESDQSNCRLYSANCVPALANTNAVDTATWFAVACKKVIKTTTVISYTQSNGSPGSISVSFAN